MREKIGALIQFLAVIISFAMIFAGIVGAYDSYFGAEGAANADVIFWTVTFAVIAIVGAAIGVVGVLVGNLLKK